MDAFSLLGTLTVRMVPGWETIAAGADLATAHGGPYRPQDSGPEQRHEGVVGASISTEGGALRWVEGHGGIMSLHGVAAKRWATFEWVPDAAPGDGPTGDDS